MNTYGEVITLEEAVEFTHTFQENNPDSIKAYTVSKDKLMLILEQEDCKGIRIYNGTDGNSSKNNLVLVGVDSTGEDMTEGVILEDLSICPPHCPKKSVLIKI